MKNKATFFLLLATIYSYGQSPLTSGYFDYQLIDRFEILSDSFSPDLFTTVKPYRRDMVSTFGQSASAISKVDEFNKNYLLTDNSIFNSYEGALRKKPLFKHFYKNKNALFLVDEDRFKLVINPVLGFSGGKDTYDSLSIYRNSRGVEVRGNIGNKVGFYSYILENQARYPSFSRRVHDSTQVVNGTTLHKTIDGHAEDFFNAIGYITYSPMEEIMIQFGQDKNFIGNGYRSLILSDFSAPYPFLKINTKVWKFNYQNLYSQHVNFIAQGESANNGRKFSALHHLSVNLTENLNIGLFENIIFDRSDTNETNRYEVAYLNPIIFYRAVEHGLNSRDNASLGLDWKWNFLNRFSFYGQFVLDEFTKDQMFGRTQSWVNKWAYQAGLKYINVGGLNNLDLQVEVNQLRPYIFQHHFKSQNWIHYNQSLHHPLGSNLREWIGIVRYQPIPRLNVKAVYSYSMQGIDSSSTGTNYGGNYLRTYQNRPVDPVPMFSGVKNSVSTMSIDVSYMLWHNLFLDAGVLLRSESNDLLVENRESQLFRFGMRLNLAALDYRE